VERMVGDHSTRSTRAMTAHRNGEATAIRKVPCIMGTLVVEAGCGKSAAKVLENLSKRRRGAGHAISKIL
jgi:hypothetical protein